MQLEKDKLDELAEFLNGTTNSIQAGLTAIGLDMDDYDVSEIEDELLGASVPVEVCSVCNWWCEVSELVDDNCEPAPCQDCREEDE